MTIVTASTRVERRFYSVVRWFGLILASIAFIAAVGLLLVSAKKLTASADKSIHAPKVSYSSFKESLEKSSEQRKNFGSDNTLERKEQEVARAQESVNFERKLKPSLESIVANLSRYAEALQVGKPSEQGVGDFIRMHVQSISEAVDADMGWNYVESVDKATSELAADAPELAKLALDDPRRIRWDQFLTIYTDKFVRGLSEERQRIGGEEMRVSVEKTEAMFIIYGAAVAFFTFITATILLVLLRIERNTRPAQ